MSECVNACEYEGNGGPQNSCKRCAHCHLCVHNVSPMLLSIKKGSHSEFVCTCVCVCACFVVCQFIVALWMPFASLFFEGKPTNLICINASTCFINGILKPHEMGLLCRQLSLFPHFAYEYEFLLMLCMLHMYKLAGMHLYSTKRRRERERETKLNTLLKIFTCKAALREIKLLHTFVRARKFTVTAKLFGRTMNSNLMP